MLSFWQSFQNHKEIETTITHLLQHNLTMLHSWPPFFDSNTASFNTKVIIQQLLEKKKKKQSAQYNDAHSNCKIPYNRCASVHVSQPCVFCAVCLISPLTVLRCAAALLLSEVHLARERCCEAPVAASEGRSVWSEDGWCSCFSVRDFKWLCFS